MLPTTVMISKNYGKNGLQGQRGHGGSTGGRGAKNPWRRTGGHVEIQRGAGRSAHPIPGVWLGQKKAICLSYTCNEHSTGRMSCQVGWFLTCLPIAVIATRDDLIRHSRRVAFSPWNPPIRPIRPIRRMRPYLHNCFPNSQNRRVIGFRFLPAPPKASHLTFFIVHPNPPPAGHF